MCKCDVIGCRYSEFLGDDSIYYVKDDDTCEEFCLFHIPEKIKDNVLASQKNLLKDKIVEYIKYIKDKGLKTIDFSSCIFHYDFPSEALRDKDFRDYTFDFSHTVFYKYFSIKNLKCEILKFKDTEFLEGGSIKNRGSSKNLYIKNLIFRPFHLDANFVIDLGRYANTEGLIESDIYGVIKKIKFKNHKKGNGIVHFIGLTEYTEEADFRNMILDNVSFQNSNLGRCLFLNAKVDKTEFRNCEFLNEIDEIDYNWIENNKKVTENFISGFVFIVLLVVGVFYKGPVFLLAFLLLIIFMPKYFNNILMLLIVFMGIPSLNNPKRIIIYDEKLIQRNLKKTDEEYYELTLKALVSLYQSLKENLGKNNFQIIGDFFYTQRTIQTLLSTNQHQRMLFLLHNIINGFGERFLRPFLLFIFTIIVFASCYTVDKDFIATDMAPSFLLEKQLNKEVYYKNQQYLDENNETHKRQYIPNKLLSCPDKQTKENYSCDTVQVQIYYSASQFISPFTLKNRAWFKTVSQKASILNFIEMVLLYLFFGAFILAVKNRIKR